MILNNFLLLIPLFAILGGVGLSIDSAFAADYVLDESFCENQMNGSWNNAVSPRLGGTCTADEYGLESGNTLEIPFHVELRMMSAQPTLGISSGATLNIAGELTIEQRSDDMDMMMEREWQGNPAIGNFGTINALDYSEVDIRPDFDSVFNSGVITIRGDSDNLEYAISMDSPGSVTNYNDDIPVWIEFTVQETLDQSTCEGLMRAEWNSNTCTMPNWVIFKSGAELTIPSDVTWILAPSDGGYNASVDEGATIINDGTIIIDTGASYPFYNQGTFINNGIYRIETAGFTGFSTYGTTENYGAFESSDMVRHWALYQSGGSFSNFGTIDVPDYLIASGVNLIEPNVVVEVTDADYVLDESFCENQMNGSWNNAVSPRLGGTCTADEYGLESGNTLEIPFHVELRMMSAQPTLGISSGATLNIAGELTIEQRSDDMDMMMEREWQGNPAIGNFGTINALDYSEVDIRPDFDSVFNSGVITIRGDSDNLEYAISMDSPGSVTNYNDDIPVWIEFTVQETLDQSTCEGLMRAEWNSNTCTMPNWVIFKSGAELTIPSDVTWILAPSDGGYNASVDEGATIINDGTIIIDTGASYPFYNQGTFINNGIYRIETAGFTGFSTYGTTENYGAFESSDMVRHWALYQSGGSFSNFGTIDVPDYLIASGVNLIEPNVVVEVTDADGDGYDSIESGGNDCDDGDATTYPGASETDPNIDSNCDGSFIEVNSVDTSSLVDANVDIIPPVINVPENTQLEVETAGSLATQFFRATAVDETDGNVAVDCTFPQNNKYRVGTTTVTCTAIDDAGNDSQKSFSVTVVVTDGDAITCGAGTELFAGECRAIPQRQDPTVDVPEITSPEVEQTQTTIGLIATVTDTFENGVTTLDIKFNKNYVNYEIDITQNGDRLLKETSHALGTTATYKVTAAGSVENPIDVKITSLGIGLPGQEDKWTGPTGLITTVQVVPEFGTITMMILVVAIVSIVAITSKSRLMTKF